MTARNIVQTTFDEFGRASGFVKKSGSWYRRSAETIVVLNLQKSQYGPQYYVNAALWLLPLGEEQFPKEHKCHVRTRLDNLVPRDRERRVAELFDLEAEMEEGARRDELTTLLRSILPMLDASATLEGLRSGDGERLIKASLVRGPAQQLLAG